LLPKLSGITISMLMPVTAPEVRAFIPMNTDTQTKESAKPIASAIPPTTSPIEVWNRNPMIIPTPTVTSSKIAYRTKSASTAPTSGADLPIGSDLNRSKTPFSISLFRLAPRLMPAMAMV